MASTDCTGASNAEGICFRRDAIGIQTAFAAMRPLVWKSQILSCNAEITSAQLGDAGSSFGIIARELLNMVKDLNNMIEQLEHVFREVSVFTAEWIKAEHRMDIYNRTLEKLSRAGINGEDGRQNIGAERLEVRLREGSAESNDKVQESVRAIVDLSKRINKFIDRISWVAVRQARFTAITARVEAAKLDDNGQGIAAVAEAIKLLAEEIAEAEAEARNQILGLNGQAKTLQSSLQLRSSAL